MRRLAVPVLVLLVLASTTGCGPRGAALFAGGALVGAAIVSAHDHRPHVHDDDDDVRIVYVPATTVYVPPPAPPERDRVPEADATARFDAVAARNAFAQIDLSACRDAGAPHGYGHAKVTFTERGNVAKVVVDGPAGLSSTAVACVGERLGTAEVPAFVGPDVTVGTTYYVR